MARRLVAITHHESVAALSDLLAQLEDGVVRLGREQVQYRAERNQPPMFYLSKFRRGDTHGPDYHPAFGARPWLSLTASGPSFTDICGGARLQDAIWELCAAKVPYESVEDFQEHFLGLRPSGWGGFGDSSVAFITAPLGLRFSEQSAIIGDELRAEVSAYGTLSEVGVRVAVVARTADGIFRDSKRVEASGWRPAPNGSAASVTWKLPGVDRATLLLTVGDETLDMLIITDPTRPSTNIRLAAHATIDAQIRELSRLLAGEGKQHAHDFENAIGLLCSTCAASA